MSEAPSGYKVQLAVSAWQSARARLLAEDEDLQHDENALAELLGPEEGDVLTVLERLANTARHAELMAASAAIRIDEIQARQSRYKARAQSMRGSIFAIMQAMEINKHEAPEMTISIRKGQQSVMITDEAKVPDIYVDTVRKIDKATILSALKSGLVVDGCVLSNGLPSLTLKVK